MKQQQKKSFHVSQIAQKPINQIRYSFLQTKQQILSQTQFLNDQSLIQKKYFRPMRKLISSQKKQEFSSNKKIGKMMGSRRKCSEERLDDRKQVDKIKFEGKYYNSKCVSPTKDEIIGQMKNKYNNYKKQMSEPLIFSRRRIRSESKASSSSKFLKQELPVSKRQYKAYSQTKLDQSPHNSSSNSKPTTINNKNSKQKLNLAQKIISNIKKLAYRQQNIVQKRSAIDNKLRYSSNCSTFAIHYHQMNKKNLNNRSENKSRIFSRSVEIKNQSSFSLKKQSENDNNQFFSKKQTKTPSSKHPPNIINSLQKLKPSLNINEVKYYSSVSKNHKQEKQRLKLSSQHESHESKITTPLNNNHNKISRQKQSGNNARTIREQSSVDRIIEKSKKWLKCYQEIITPMRENKLQGKIKKDGMQQKVNTNGRYFINGDFLNDFDKISSGNQKHMNKKNKHNSSNVDNKLHPTQKSSPIQQIDFSSLKLQQSILLCLIDIFNQSLSSSSPTFSQPLNFQTIHQYSIVFFQIYQRANIQNLLCESIYAHTEGLTKIRQLLLRYFICKRMVFYFLIDLKRWLEVGGQEKELGQDLKWRERKQNQLSQWNHIDANYKTPTRQVQSPDTSTNKTSPTNHSTIQLLLTLLKNFQQIHVSIVNIFYYNQNNHQFMNINQKFITKINPSITYDDSSLLVDKFLTLKLNKELDKRLYLIEDLVNRIIGKMEVMKRGYGREEEISRMEKSQVIEEGDQGEKEEENVRFIIKVYYQIGRRVKDENRNDSGKKIMGKEIEDENNLKINVKMIFQIDQYYNWTYLAIPPVFYLPPVINPTSSPSPFYTIVLDLQRTLIFYNQQTRILKYRPYMDHFLSILQNYFNQIIIWSSYTKQKTDIIIKQIERYQQGSIFDYRLYKNHMVFYQGSIRKNIRYLGRDMRWVVMVDDEEKNSEMWRGNGISVKEFVGDKQDRELMEVGERIKELMSKKPMDLREGLKENNIISRTGYLDQIQETDEISSTIHHSIVNED